MSENITFPQTTYAGGNNHKESTKIQLLVFYLVRLNVSTAYGTEVVISVPGTPNVQMCLSVEMCDQTKSAMIIYLRLSVHANNTVITPPYLAASGVTANTVKGQTNNTDSLAMESKATSGHGKLV